MYCELVFDVHKCSCSCQSSELTTGSNTPPTDSTNLRVTMQEKSGIALSGVTL